MVKRKVFMIMPFQDEFFEVYEMLKMEFDDKFVFSNAGDESNQQNILKDIIQPIYEAEIIIADLTGLNANVMYELGIAHSFNKKTIIITQDDLSKLPFDLKQYRTKDYTTHFKKFNELLEYLRSNLNGAIDNTVVYSNPVRDFLKMENIDYVSWFADNTNTLLENASDKGFLDFLAEIESNTNSLSETITELTNDMNDMNNGIITNTNEIKKADKNSQGSASFVRKKSKKIASYIDKFGKNLRNRNKEISSLWDAIEINSLGLLENKFVTIEENKAPLIEYLFSLYYMKEPIDSSNESMKGMKKSMENSIGLERSLNQAIRFVIADISSYITITERIKSSIDKIIEKSKFVVGYIDFNKNFGK